MDSTLARLYHAAYAASTVRAHATGWEKWTRHMQGRDPYMRGYSVLEQRRCFIDFCEHLVFEGHCTKFTLAGINSAVTHRIAGDIVCSVNVYGDVVIRYAFSCQRLRGRGHQVCFQYS